MFRKPGKEATVISVGIPFVAVADDVVVVVVVVAVVVVEVVAFR